MKRDLFIIWSLLFVFLLAGCSDNNDPDPGPEPPAGEWVEGINQTPKDFEAGSAAQIVFKAPKTSDLYGYTGDVYVHIGVVEGTEWLFKPAEWNENVSKCRMKREEDNVWSISLSPDIRSWFGVPEGTSVLKIGIVFRSADGAKQSEDFFIAVADEVFTPGKVVMEAQPAGTIEGVNIKESAVTFVLYDKDINGKRKDYAYLIGDFNDWKLSNDYQMKRDDATGCWWYTLDRSALNPQTEYAFQYYIGTVGEGAIRLADAYTEKVLDPQDKYISASTYPNLRAYPADKTAGIISTFRIQPEAYNWQVKDFQVQDKHNLVIYEMLFRDFTDTGDINGAMQRLDYLKALGVNAIELMPVQEFDGNDSWGYNPCFYFAMDKAYGTRKMYKEFIDACHSKGMAVILDVVYNHATGANPFAKLYWNSKDNKTAANNPWFNVDAPHPHSVFHDFNHESPLVRQFVKRNLRFLLEEYNIDGFRFDLTKGFTQQVSGSDDGKASAYDPSRIKILKDYNAAIKEVNPDAVVILEHFTVETEEIELAKDGMVLWRSLNGPYCETAMGRFDPKDPGKSSFTRLYTGLLFSGDWVGYMESHDEERAAFKQLEYGNEEYKLKTDLPTRMRQLEVNSSLFFTVPGPKMIWQFGELGYDVSINENGRTGRKPIRWEYYGDSNRKSLYDTYSKLITLRTSGHPDLFTAATSVKMDVNSWNTGRYVSLKGVTGKGLVAVGNFTNNKVVCKVNFQSTGTWYNYLKVGERIEVTSTEQDVELQPNSFLLYTNFQ